MPIKIIVLTVPERDRAEPGVNNAIEKTVGIDPKK